MKQGLADEAMELLFKKYAKLLWISTKTRPKPSLKTVCRDKICGISVDNAASNIAKSRQFFQLSPKSFRRS